MVLPLRPEGTDGWTEDQLVEIITRDSMIGVAVPKVGVTSNAGRNYLHAMHTSIRPTPRASRSSDDTTSTIPS